MDNNKRVFVETYRIYAWMDDSNKPVWSDLPYYEWSHLDFNEGYLHTFKGKRAIVAVFTYDIEITRAMKLKIATDWMGGNYVRINVDLAKLTTEHENGIEH